MTEPWAFTNPKSVLKTQLRDEVDISGLHIISVISNPLRFKSRYELYDRFTAHMAALGANHWTVEIAIGDRAFAVTDSSNPRHIQLRTQEILWHKENMIELAINRLPRDWKQVAWIDADVSFQRHDILSQIVHQLQVYDVVQLFSHAIDLGPQGEPIQTHNGFIWSYEQNDRRPPQGPGYNGYYGYKPKERGFWHPGYAWAANRSFINKVGIFTSAILGSGDHHMAMAFIGQVGRSIPNNIGERYRDEVEDYQRLCTQYLNTNVGYVAGSIFHEWHGKKKDRRYVDRWKILIDNDFDPDDDIYRDWQGLWQLVPEKPRLRDQIRMYFGARSEDSIDL
jgi:hypothetical protein